MLLYGHRRTHAKSLLIIVCKVMEVFFVISVNCLYTWIFYNPNWWVQSNENNQKTWRKPKQKLILKTDCFNERCKIVFQQHGKKSTLLMIPGTTAEKSLHHSEQSQMHHCGTIILCTGIKLVFYAFCIYLLATFNRRQKCNQEINLIIFSSIKQGTGFFLSYQIIFQRG